MMSRTNSTSLYPAPGRVPFAHLVDELMVSGARLVGLPLELADKANRAASVRSPSGCLLSDVVERIFDSQERMKHQSMKHQPSKTFDNVSRRREAATTIWIDHGFPGAAFTRNGIQESAKTAAKIKLCSASWRLRAFCAAQTIDGGETSRMKQKTLENVSIRFTDFSHWRQSGGARREERTIFSQ